MATGSMYTCTLKLLSKLIWKKTLVWFTGHILQIFLDSSVGRASGFGAGGGGLKSHGPPYQYFLKVDKNLKMIICLHKLIVQKFLSYCSDTLKIMSTKTKQLAQF